MGSLCHPQGTHGFPLSPPGYSWVPSKNVSPFIGNIYTNSCFIIKMSKTYFSLQIMFNSPRSSFFFYLRNNEEDIDVFHLQMSLSIENPQLKIINFHNWDILFMLDQTNGYRYESDSLGIGWPLTSLASDWLFVLLLSTEFIAERLNQSID